MTVGSARRSSQRIEYGVSLFGVMIAVSAGVATWCMLLISLNGALNCPEFLAAANSCMTA
jgi:hypothetical protein